jgi:hypothetical protein
MQTWDWKKNVLEVKTRPRFRGIAPVMAKIQEKPFWMSFYPWVLVFNIKYTLFTRNCAKSVFYMPLSRENNSVLVSDASQQGSRYSSSHTEIDSAWDNLECTQTPSLYRHAGPACCIQTRDWEDKVLAVKTRPRFREIAPVSSKIQAKPLRMSLDPPYQGFN